MLVVDNVLWSAEIVDEAAGGNVPVLRAFNDKGAANERVETVVLPTYDGLTLARKR